MMTNRYFWLAAFLSVLGGCASPEPASITLPPVLGTIPARVDTPIATTLPSNHWAFIQPLEPRVLAAHPSYPAGSMPDPIQTPRAVFTNVTHDQLCTPGYSASGRNVSQATKNQVFANYHITGPHGNYEVDHLISLELGGSNDSSNLWPESFRNVECQSQRQVGE